MCVKKKTVYNPLLLVLSILLMLFTIISNAMAVEIVDLSASNRLPIKGRSLNMPLESEHFVYHPGNTGVLAYSMLGQVPESIYSEMAARYHYRQRSKIDIYVYSNRNKFLEESPSMDAVGYAVPSGNKIAILIGGDIRDWQTTIAHEINHIILIQSVPKIDTVPHWFMEGLAIYESHPGVKVAKLEEQALAKDLPDIISSHSTAGPAELKDYGQGYLLIGFIVSEFGRESLDNIIAGLQSGADFNTAVTRALSVTPEELNNRSKSFMRVELFYIWLLKLQDFVWYFASILFIVAGVIAYVKKRRRLSETKDDDIDTENDDGQGFYYDDSDARSRNENEFEGVDFGDGAMV